jgi:dihydropteroate synthase
MNRAGAHAPGTRPAHWQIAGGEVLLARPLIMGIVNVTPDSFSDGGRYFDPGRAIEHGQRLVAEGADLLDIGGESTRPGAAEVGVDEELARVLPVLRGLRDAGAPLSVDTSKPQVMRAALAEGAAIVNDVRALAAPGAIEAVRDHDCGLVLMHMQGAPRGMQADPRYDDVVAEVRDFLLARAAACEAAGIARGRIALDPGFGFGKTLAHNLALLGRLECLAATAYPVLAGLSRKSMLGAITGRPADERAVASAAAALLAVQRGARIVRVHDVGATVDALKVWQALQDNDQQEQGGSR